MKRTKPPKRATAILAGDMHLREDVPICRLDDYWSAQIEKLGAIRELQIRHQCPIIHSGDLFNHWKPSPRLLTTAIEHLPEWLGTVYGNHDLPQHNLDLTYKCGIRTLEAADKIEVLPEAHWGENPENGSIFFPASSMKMLVWHVMTWTGDKPWPGCEDPTAEELLEDFPEYDIILTGHNHKTFVVEQDGRLLVNPGSMMRMSADQVGHEPSVFLWYEKGNTVERVILPHERGVVSRDHIEADSEKDRSRFQAFIHGLREDAPQISFETNMEEYFRQYKVVKSVRNLIWESMEDGE